MEERVSRRDRLREQLRRDIKRSARKILTEQGPSALTLSAIAREVEVTAPALYRYYAGLPDIVRGLAEDLVSELVETMQAAVERHPSDDLAGRLWAATYAFREWANANVVEFRMLFGPPTPAAGPAQTELTEDWMLRLAGVWGPLVFEAWRKRDFPVRDENRMPKDLLEQMSHYREVIGRPELPAGVIKVFLDCWRQIYGAVCLEVFGHMGPAITDHEPLFRTMVNELLMRLGFSEHECRYATVAP